MRRPPLDAITLINLPPPSLVIAIKVRNIVVEIFGTGAEVTTKQGGVCDEDGGDVDGLFLDEDQADSDEPFVEHGDHDWLVFTGLVW